MTIKVCIGTEPKTSIPFVVLAYSIQKHASVPVEIYPMMGKDWQIKPNKYIGTGFSLLRWDIPRIFDYKGFAIYLDVDQIVLSDIKELYESDLKYPNKECSCWCTYQKSKWYKNPTPETSVMLIDCEKAKTNQPGLAESLQYIESDPNPAKRERYIKIMRAMKHRVLPQTIPNNWNRLNTLTGKDDCLLHYTKEPEQPWYNPKHPHTNLWEKHLKEVIDQKILTKELINLACTAYRPHTKRRRGEGLHPYYKKYI